MATGYRIGGADLDELYEMPHVGHLTRTNFNYREETNLITSNRYLKNGQPIKTSLQKTIFKKHDYGTTTEAGFMVEGVRQVLSDKRSTPFGYLLATLSAGEHELTEDENGKVYLDNVELPYAPAADKLFFVLAAGGGGGAGSGLTFCSAGGAGGQCAQWASTNYSGTYYGARKYPFKLFIGSGGAGGGGDSDGQQGGNTTLTTYRTTTSNPNTPTEYIKTLYGGGGGQTNNGNGGTASSQWNNDWDISSGDSNGFLRAGNGGKKESNGEASSLIYGTTNLPEYMTGDPILQPRNGGVSSGNNHGGGGGASGLADGAPGNNRKDGVAGTLGAGGSGAGFTAFNEFAGGKGGDGVGYIYY